MNFVEMKKLDDFFKFKRLLVDLEGEAVNKKYD
jgi:hypothetical protein